MSCELDPKEVLVHLHELGYYNITPEQLKEFIRDLEQLIQHDITKKNKRAMQSKSPDDSVSSPLPTTTDESARSSPPPLSNTSHARNHHPVRKPSKTLENVSCSSSESSIAPSRRVLRECTKHLSQKNEERGELFRSRPKSADPSKSQSKPVKTCDCAWRRIGCKCCEELMSQEQNSLKTKSKENLAPPRPKSSYAGRQLPCAQVRPSGVVSAVPAGVEAAEAAGRRQPQRPAVERARAPARTTAAAQEQSCCCDCKCCPCKLNEKDFSKNPKKVSSKILPRGPFHIQGRILGPVGHQRDGGFEISERELRGVFEVGSDSSEDDKRSGDPPQSSEQDTHKARERAVWLSKKDIEKVKDTEEVSSDIQTIENSFSLTEEEIKSRRKNHDRSTCKYCGLIHYMLSSSEGSDSNRKSEKYVNAKEKSERHPVFDLKRKECDVNDPHVNPILPRGDQNNRQQDFRNRINQQVCDKIKDICSSKGYWHQQFTRPGVQKGITEIRKTIESSTSRLRQLSQQSPPRAQFARHDTVDSSPPREQWPHRMCVQADVHRPNESSILSPGSRATRPTSTPVSSRPNSPRNRPTEHIPKSPLSDRRDYRPVLNLATATNLERKNPQRQSDSYFETRIPVTLKGFQGEVKTEVEVHKSQRKDGSKSPLVTVATKVKIHKI